MNVRPLVAASYSLVNRSGLLRSRVAKRLFRSVYFSYKRLYEDPYLRLVRRNPAIFQGGHILDVGANIGYTASVFSEAVDNSWQVFAFEPEPDNFQMLEESIGSYHGQSRVVPVRSAVGASEGTARLWINKDLHADHRILTDQNRDGVDAASSTDVPMTTLDAFTLARGIRDQIKFIKIDVQGFEIAVCQGMGQTLADSPDACVAIEYDPAGLADMGFEPTDLLRFFEEREFLPYLLSREHGLQPMATDEWRALAARRSGYVDFVFSRRADLV